MLTLCPHCYSTFKNDYKEIGAQFEGWVHHTGAFEQLIENRKAPA